MESRSNQIVSVLLGSLPAEQGSPLVKPRPLNDQEIEKRVLATLRKPYVPDPDKGSWQGGAFEAEILMNLTGIQPRDLVVKTLLKVIDGTETSSQDQRRLALLHLSGAIPKELVPRLIQTLKLWETKPFNPRDRIGPRVEIEMLGRMGQDATEAIPVLIKLLDLPDWNVRGDAIQALVKIGPRSPLVIQAIFERLDDAETVYQAARFGELGKPHAAKLVPLLESKRAGMRTWAAWGLVTSGYDRDRGLEFLVKQVATGSSEEKKLAATALAALGSQSRPVLEKLRTLEKGTQPDVAKEIQEAVARIEKDERILTHGQEADKVVASRIASREAVKRIQETTPQPLVGKGTIEQINNSGFLLEEGLILTTNDATTYFQMVEAKEVAIARKDVKVGSTIQWEGVPGRAITKMILLDPKPQPATPAKPMTGRGVGESPNPVILKTIPGTEIAKPQPINPSTDTPRQIGSLTGQFVLDGKVPTPKDLYPGFSRIDPNGPQLPGPDGRFSGVEMIYREFLKKGIRPRTEDASLLIGPKGGIANILVWAVKKEMTLPDSKPDPKPVIIRLKDGNFSPRLTIVPVGQSLIVENQDPVSFQIRLFSNVNPEFNQLLRPNQDDWGTTWKPTQPESLPLRYRSDVGPWADGWIVVPPTPFVAISGLDGSFSIPNLPVGEWEFRGWHERMGFLKIWPSGKIKQKIDPGHNSLGSIKIREEWFGEGSPPKAPEVSSRNSQPEFGPVPDSGPKKGLEFLKPYTSLHGLSLDMTEDKFLEIAKQKKLKLRKEGSGDRIHYLLRTGDGHTVIVMFAGVGEKCSGIQRIRGEESDPPALEENPGTSPPSVSRDNPLERKISGNIRNLSLQEGLNTIAKTANVTLQLDQAGLKETGLDLKKSISVDFAYVPLSTALGRVINWEKHPGLMYEMRGNKLVITTLAEYQKHIESHLPDWLKVHYNKGLLAKLDADHQVISITTSGIVTDELLAKIASLPRLKDLYIEATRQMTPAGLKHLAKMGSLEALALHDLQYEEKGLGDIIIPQLIGLKTLRELTIANCGLTDTGARSLENLSQLTLLSLTNEGKLTDEALASISRLTNLKSLNLSSSANLTRQISPLTEAGLKKLTVLEGLEELHLVGHPVTGEVLKFPKLKTLSLGFSSVGDDCAQRIANFQDLRSLQLRFTGITDNGLKQIAGLPCLIQLSLDSSVITDQGIESLRKSKTLSHLSLRASQLTDRSLGYVAQIPSLTRIDLNGSGEPGFQPGNCFTMIGVEQLKILPLLRTLWLTNFQSPGGYMGLKDFTQLQELTFLMADIRQTDVEALEEALPNTRIHAATGGGFVSPKINSKKNPK